MRTRGAGSPTAEPPTPLELPPPPPREACAFYGKPFRGGAADAILMPREDGAELDAPRRLPPKAKQHAEAQGAPADAQKLHRKGCYHKVIGEIKALREAKETSIAARLRHASGDYQPIAKADRAVRRSVLDELSMGELLPDGACLALGDLAIASAEPPADQHEGGGSGMAAAEGGDGSGGSGDGSGGSGDGRRDRTTQDAPQTKALPCESVETRFDHEHRLQPHEIGGLKNALRVQAEREAQGLPPARPRCLPLRSFAERTDPHRKMRVDLLTDEERAHREVRKQLEALQGQLQESNTTHAAELERVLEQLREYDEARVALAEAGLPNLPMLSARAINSGWLEPSSMLTLRLINMFENLAKQPEGWRYRTPVREFWAFVKTRQSGRAAIEALKGDPRGKRGEGGEPIPSDGTLDRVYAALKPEKSGVVLEANVRQFLAHCKRHGVTMARRSVDATDITEEPQATRIDKRTYRFWGDVNMSAFGGSDPSVLEAEFTALCKALDSAIDSGDTTQLLDALVAANEFMREHRDALDAAVSRAHLCMRVCGRCACRDMPALCQCPLPCTWPHS